MTLFREYLLFRTLQVQPWMFSWTNSLDLPVIWGLKQSHNHGATDSVVPYNFKTSEQTRQVILPHQDIHYIQLAREILLPRIARLRSCSNNCTRPLQLSSPTPTVVVAAPVTPDRGDWSDVHSIHSFSQIMQMTWYKGISPFSLGYSQSMNRRSWFSELSQHEAMLFSSRGR